MLIFIKTLTITIKKELSMTKIRLEEELIQKKDLVSKINTLQIELDKKVTERTKNPII